MCIRDRLNTASVPDAIFVDRPLHNTEFKNFCFFLRRKNYLSNTLVIYNETRLDVQKVRILRQLELVDDVLDLNSPEINFSRKISFLQKGRKWQNNFINNEAETSVEKETKSNLPSAKRLFDIVFSLISILLFSPLLILLAIIIRLDSKGPVIYTSRRAGKGYKIFDFYKFRTMRFDADQKIESVAHLNQYEKENNGAKFMKICNDPRVTRVGKILRKISLDELPQLFNVLKGDMSVVGNRPLPLYEASTLTTDESVERFMAPAGITGLWQVKKRGKPQMSAHERISLDISYARESNFFYDIWIIVKTPSVLFQKTNV